MTSWAFPSIFPYCQVLITLSISNTPNKRAALRNPRDSKAQTNPTTPCASRQSHHVTESTPHIKRSTLKKTWWNTTQQNNPCSPGWSAAPISARDLTEYHHPCMLRTTVFTCMLSPSVLWLYILAETHTIAYFTSKHKPTHKHTITKSRIHLQRAP